jgi:hypothetical protein
MSSISIYFSAFLEDFSYETGVKKPYRTVGLNRAGHPPRKFILCGTGILPVLAIYAHPTRKFILCGTGILPVLAIYRWVDVGCRLGFTVGGGGFSRLCVLGKDGLSNPPLRDIAKLWNIRRQPFGAQLFNS